MPLTAGRAYVYFFPLGQTEPAIITLSDVDSDEHHVFAGRAPHHGTRPHLQPGGVGRPRARPHRRRKATQVQP